MAGHLSVGGDGTGLGWGAGLGSSSISGGPYHFHLNQLENPAASKDSDKIISLGSQDNQIKGSNIQDLCADADIVVDEVGSWA